MGAEYELKYRATAESHRAIRQAFSGAWESLTMQTTYYDTPDGRLSGKRYTLRKRLENGVSICTLKTPGKDNTRGEWETPCREILLAIPELCKLGGPADLPHLCSGGLISVCGAEFTRQALTLSLPGCTAELALDEGLLFGGKTTLPLVEVELELKEGSKEALQAFARDFAAKYRLQTEENSKFARALALTHKE